MIETIDRLVESKGFQRLIVTVILANAVIIGLETYPAVMAHWSGALHLADRVCLGIFVIEIILKLIACGSKPQRFFHSGWNTFDFIIVAAAFIPGMESQSTVLRLIRLLRVLRLLSALPSMQIMVMAIMHSVPRIGQMALLAALLFYIYGVIGYSLFAQHDPQHWGSLHISLLSLFRVLTLEDWTDLMYKGMELHPWSWIYFVSFVLFATFIIFNMLIGIILNSMEEARHELAKERLGAVVDTDDALRSRIEAVRASLDDLEEELKERERK